MSIILFYVCVCARAHEHVCVCVWERERERKEDINSKAFIHLVFVGVCASARTVHVHVEIWTSDDGKKYKRLLLSIQQWDKIILTFCWISSSSSFLRLRYVSAKSGFMKNSKYPPNIFKCPSYQKQEIILANVAYN